MKNNIFYLLIFILLILILLIIVIVYKKRKTKNVSNYFLDIWDNIRSPLEIGYLVDGKMKYEHIVGTLLKFISEKYIKVIPIYKNDEIISYELEKIKSDIYNPKPYINLVDIKKIELKDIKYLMKKKLSISEIYVINRMVFNDNDKISIKDIEKFYDNKDCIGEETEELLAKKVFATKLIQKELEICGILNENKKKLTTTGKMKKQEWIDFSSKLKEETYMKEKDINSITIWGENLAIGVALSVCKASIKDANKLYKGTKFI